MKDRTCFRHYGQSLIVQGAPQEAIDTVRNALDISFGFVLCQKFGVRPDTMAKSCADACAEGAPELSPNMFVSLGVSAGSLVVAHHLSQDMSDWQSPAGTREGGSNHSRRG